MKFVQWQIEKCFFFVSLKSTKQIDTVDFKYKGQKVFGDFDQMSLVPG